ncbi:MAG: regulatory protein [Actinomycetia bacterium]|nr:regulatory protein [Actinomycetes bacterium]
MGEIVVMQGRPIDWVERAACKDEDPELFFPLGTLDVPHWQVSRAKRICAVCPVRGECLDYALETGQEYGVWGETTEQERRALRGRIQARARRVPRSGSGSHIPANGARRSGTTR